MYGSRERNTAPKTVRSGPQADPAFRSTVERLFLLFPLPMWHYSIREHRFLFVNAHTHSFFRRDDPDFEPSLLSPGYVLHHLQKYNSEEVIDEIRKDFESGGIVTKEFAWPAQDGGRGAAMIRA